MNKEPSSQVDWSSYQNLTFESFRKRATNPNFDEYEKMGNPTFYRKGFDQAIFEDICSKLKGLNEPGNSVLDIGSGCGSLAKSLIQHCQRKNQKLILMDSAEMLAHLPEGNGVEKMSGRFPDAFGDFIKANREKLDVILCYGMISVVFLDMNIFNFLDEAMSLLRPGGELLIGDIPNISKRNRFFSSDTGIKFHKDFMGTTEAPEVKWSCIQDKKMDDSVVLSILGRYRSFGFDAYLLPQRKDLPMSNRREDILIRRP